MRTDLFSPVFNSITRHEVVYAALYGSQSYNMAINDDTYQSDIDYKAIIVPTLKDLVYNKKPVSQVVEIDDGQIDIKDIRKFMETLLKCNPAYVECFITPYYTGNQEFEEIRNLVPTMVWELRENFIRACFGMLVEKHVALCHPYPSIKDKIDKYGFDAKQLHHMMRLLKMMQDFDETGKVILVPDNKDYLIDIKRGNYSLEEAKFMAKETEDAARAVKEKLLSRYLTQCHTFDAVERIRQIGFEITEKSIIAEVC